MIKYKVQFAKRNCSMQFYFIVFECWLHCYSLNNISLYIYVIVKIELKLKLILEFL